MPAFSTENRTNVRTVDVVEHDDVLERRRTTVIESSAETAPPKRSSRPRAKGIGLRAARVLGGLAPKTAAAWGANRFFTPSRDPAHEFGRDTLAAGQAFRVYLGAVSLAAWSWGEGPMVLLVHGWGGRAAQLAWLVKPLTEAGFRVVAFDAPAHGASGGRRSDVLHMSRAIEAVARSQGGAYGVIAHSLGGLVVGLAVERGLKLERMALIGALAQAATVLPYFSAALGIGPKAARGMRQQIEKRVGTELDQLDLTAIGRNLAASVPATLVIHDRHDEEVSWHNGRAIAAAWHGAQLITTEGLGHMRILRDPAVVEHLRGFMRGSVFDPKESRAAAE